MSLPNTGSTTGLAPAGAYGTRFSQRRIVCQSPAIEPAIVSATRTATTAMIPPAQRGRIRNVAGGDVDSRAAAACRVLPRRTPRAPRVLGSLRGLVEAVDQRPERAAVAARGRQEPAGEPEVSEQHEQDEDAAEHEQPNLHPEPPPEDGVVADARVPDRVGPELDADREHENDEDRDEDPDDDEDLAPQARGRHRRVAPDEWGAGGWRSRSPSDEPPGLSSPRSPPSFPSFPSSPPSRPSSPSSSPPGGRERSSRGGSPA